MRPTVFVSVLMVTFAVAALPAAAEEGRTLTERIDDAAITTEVKARLVAERPASLTSIDVDTFRGVVRLQGTVPSADDKGVAERIARNTSGVKSVDNDLVVRYTGAAEERSPAASPAGKPSPAR